MADERPVLTSRKGVVAWADTDASGWIHYTAPQRWAEEAEHNWVRSLTPAVDPGSFPRREVRASYLRPLRAGDPFDVLLSVAKVGTTSVTYSWQVLGGGAVCVQGEHTAIHLGADGRPSPLPDQMRAVLESDEHE